MDNAVALPTAPTFAHKLHSLPPPVGRTWKSKTKFYRGDNYFDAGGLLSAHEQPVCGVIDRASAKARSHLHVPALAGLNDELSARAETAGLMPKRRVLLDGGQPAAWFVKLLQERGIRFIMRCDTRSGGWTALRRFIQSSAPEAHITLSAPQPQDAADRQCSPQAPTVRVVRQIAPNGQTRVLMTHLTAAQAPAHCFGGLYHQRWRIEEAFKRLKHRLRLEAVSGLSQHALLIDVAAKIWADNLAALLARATSEAAGASPGRPCNLAFTLNVLQRITPRLLAFVGGIGTLIASALAAIACTIMRRKPHRSAPRKHDKLKPHPSAACKV